MSIYHIIIKIPGFSIPYPIKIKTVERECYLYPGNLIQDIRNLEEQLFFNENNIICYESFKVGELNKDEKSKCYIGFDIDLDYENGVNEFINVIWKNIYPVILTFDYLLSNIHNIDTIYIFNMENKFLRLIKINNQILFWSRKLIHLRKNLVKDLEDFITCFVKKLESNKRYLEEFDLFLRGKLYLEQYTYNPRKGNRNAFDILTDLWESIEHISRIYWEINNEKYEALKRETSNATQKVPKIKNMCKEISLILTEDDEKLIQDIYSKFYNIKKHETSNLDEIDLNKLAFDLLKITKLIDKIIMKLFKIYPDLIEYNEFSKYGYLIEPRDKETDFTTTLNITKRKQELMREPYYFNLVRFIEFDPMQNIFLDTFYNSFGCQLSIGNYEKTVKIHSLNNFEIRFTIYNIDSDFDDVVKFGEVYEFKYNSYFLRVQPCGRINYINRTSDSITLTFPSFYIDIEIKR